MARAKKAPAKKKTRVAAGPSAPDFARSFGEAIGRTVRPLLPLIIMAVMYGAMSWALWWPVREDAQAVLTRETIGAPLLSTKTRPAWMPENELRKIAALGLVAEGRSVFEPGLAREIAVAYESSPWVERVGAVRLRYPAAMKVEGIITRKPFARVEAEGGYVVVDARGYVLPVLAGDLAESNVLRAHHAPAAQMDLPSVTGAGARRAPFGAQLGQPEALEGLDLIGAVQEVLDAAPGALKAVRATRDESGAWRVYLDLHHRPWIEWGYWSDELRREGEPTTRDKKEWLGRRLNQCDPLRLRYIRLDVPGAAVMPLGTETVGL